MSRQVLRGVDVEQAYRQAEQEMDAGLDWKPAFDKPLVNLLHL